MTKALAAEALGTFAVALLSSGAVLTNASLGPAGYGWLGMGLVYGLTVAVMMSMTLPVSGGHLNPAITLALVAVGRMRFAPGLRYIGAQLVGALLAGLVLRFVIFDGVKAPGNVDVVKATSNGAPRVSVIALGDAGRPDELSTDRAGLGAMRARANQKACAIEFVLTALLMLVYFGGTLDPRRINLGGFGVGMVILAGALMAGPLTGAAMNPARVLGACWVAGGDAWGEHWVYWIGPGAGAIVGAFAYQYLVLDQSTGRPTR